MGYYRLFLAFMVVASHMNYAIAGYNTGIVAVCSFYILSGYVMTALISKYYTRFSDIVRFYVDRFIRLSPQFYLYSSLTAAGLLLFGMHHTWMQENPTFLTGLSQFLIIPLNFYRELPSMFLPQAWSLGLEAMFYICFPFILLLRARLIVAIPSIVVFGMAVGGWIDTDLFAYRYLPGTLFIFICGSWLYHVDRKWESYIPYIISVLMIIMLCLTYMMEVQSYTTESRDVLLGVGLGIPIVAQLRGTFTRDQGDALAGDLSYGVFLNHNLIIGAIASFTPWSPVKAGAFELLAIAGICLLASGFSYASYKTIERPFISRRHNLRRPRSALTKSGGQPAVMSG